MSDKTAIQLREECKKYNLDVPDYFYALEDKKLEAIWNGYGPDDWPSFLRSFITYIYRNFECAALPHDVRFEYSDGSIEGCKIANAEMFKNLKKLLNQIYPWSKPWLYPLKLVAWVKIEGAIKALGTAACFEAYYEAFKKKVK